MSIGEVIKKVLHFREPAADGGGGRNALVDVPATILPGSEINVADLGTQANIAGLGAPRATTFVVTPGFEGTLPKE